MNEDREENGYPARSHDCQPAETEFAEDFELSQQDVERREKNAKKKRTMVMWKNSLKHVWETQPRVTEDYKATEMLLKSNFRSEKKPALWTMHPYGSFHRAAP